MGSIHWQGADLSPEQRLGVCEEWNVTTIAEPPAQCIHTLFEAQVERTPDAVAVACPASGAGHGSTHHLTYQELNRRSNQLAHHLRRLGLRPGVRAGICIERSVELIIGVLGILKAGAAYVPLDPTYPKQRLAFMLESAQALVVVTRQALVESIPKRRSQVVCLDTDLDLIAQPSPANPTCRVTTDDLLYVIYTSGSTGQPKGAGVYHRGFANLVHWFVSEFEIVFHDRVLIISSLSFDLTQKNIFAPLITGGALYLFASNHYDPGIILRLMYDHAITLLNCTPSTFYPLVAQIDMTCARTDSLRYVFLGGEPIAVSRMRNWITAQACKTIIVNTYGPTECTDIVAFYRLNDPERFLETAVPIGKPILNTKLYILDKDLAFLPAGAVGELCVAGAGVGSGYLNDCAQTAVTFVPNPFDDGPGTRLYRTGDLVRYLADGNITFLGRIDDQVKLRGFRIALGEIETVLAQHAAVQACVVVAQADGSGDQRLVAYLVPQPEQVPNITDLRQFLHARLPEYLVPSAFVFLAALPLTASGKLDRRALPAPWRALPMLEQTFVAPRTPLEQLLAALWRDLLGLEAVGVHDSFFELGGNSIQAALFANRLQTLLGEVVYVVAVFDAPTIAELARYLAEHYPAAITRLCGSDGSGSGVAQHRAGPAQPNPISETNIAEIRRVITPLPPTSAGPTDAPNPPAIFILSPPRSGSTLLRVMLAGHSRLFAPPELELLSFNTLAERKAAFTGRDRFWLEGTVRAIMAIKGCDASAAERLMAACEQQALSVRQFYRQLQAWLGDRTLVDKTPAYALDPAILARMERDFAQAKYIHLLRHPYAMIRSFEAAKLDQVFFRYRHSFTTRALAELIWLISQQHIMAFLQSISAERQHRVRFEELVTHPRSTLADICAFLGLDFQPTMLELYQAPQQRMTDGIHALTKMVGDVKFHTYREIDATVSDRWKQQPLSDPLGAITWQVAEALGYPCEPHEMGVTPICTAP
jgi:amino acid adenylation domain-containing protein